MGQSCGRDWYYSNIIVGNEHHKPYCTWIDQDHSNDIKTSALQIHMEDFVDLTSDLSDDAACWCNYPTMLFKERHTYQFNKYGNDIWNNAKPDKPGEYDIWNGPNKGDWGLESGQIKKRTVRNHRRDASSVKAFTHLVASLHDSHSAHRLCESETSHGPDFVSLSEGVFCDMQTKALWPLCSEDGLSIECYHWDTHSLVTGTERVAKNYTHVEQWD